MIELVPCRECRRHVRVGSSCPFCGAIAPLLGVRAAPRASGRFAMLFAGAISLSACGEQASPDLEPPPEVAPRVEAQPQLEVEAQPVEVVAPVEPVAPVEVTPVPVEEPAETIARPRPRPIEQMAVPAYGGPALRPPTPDPGGPAAAYGGPPIGPDGL